MWIMILVFYRHVNHDIGVIFGTILTSGSYNLIRWVCLVVAELIWMIFDYIPQRVVYNLQALYVCCRVWIVQCSRMFYRNNLLHRIKVIGILNSLMVWAHQTSTFCRSACTKPGKWAVVYLCVRSINFASPYNADIWF